MPSAMLSQFSDLAAGTDLGNEAPSIRSTCEEVIQRAHETLVAWQGAPENLERQQALIAAFRAAAGEMSKLPRSAAQSKITSAGGNLIRKSMAAQVHARLGAELVRDLEPSVATQKGWANVFARMLLVPAWKSPPAPALNEVPDWMWSDYASWLFHTPLWFAQQGESDAFAAHLEKRAEELSRWVERNPASNSVRAAWQAYRYQLRISVLKLGGSSLRKFAEAHARMLARMTMSGRAEPEVAAASRADRKLKVGVITVALDARMESLATLASFANLDPERFEVAVFLLSDEPSRERRFTEESGVTVSVLPSEMLQRIETLRGARLDCAIFGEALCGSFDELALLATRRVAPLQIATAAGNDVTSGFPQMDLFVTSADAAELADQFTERLALVPGPVRTFHGDFLPTESGIEPTRAGLGLPEDAVVFVTAAAFDTISAETRSLWARLVARTPNSYLLIQRLPGDRTDATGFAASFDAVWEAEALAPERLVIAAGDMATVADAGRVLRLGDVCLDTIPSGDDGAMLEALRAGRPVVTLGGATLRAQRGAALLRSLDLGELCATDANDYLARAERLAGDAEERANLQTKIEAVLGGLPRVLDSLAASDGLAAVLELAFDELVSIGAKEFRSSRTPIVVKDCSLADTLREGQDALEAGDLVTAEGQAARVLGAAPNDIAARLLMGRALLRQNKNSRAVDYLLAAVQSGGAELGTWFELAKALQANGQMQQALQALETGLRLDPANAEGWVMFVEAAERAGAIELGREALEQLKKCAPQHPLLEELELRLSL